MGDRVKFSAILIIAVLVSAITSYAITIALQNPQNNQTPNPQVTSTPKPQNNNQTSTNKIFPLHEEYYSTQINGSHLTVTSGVAIRDLTIMYTYTSLNGSAYTEEIHYGDYYPTWSPNHVIQPGDVQFQYYGIPQSIISACSSTKGVFDRYGLSIRYSI